MPEPVKIRREDDGGWGAKGNYACEECSWTGAMVTRHAPFKHAKKAHGRKMELVRGAPYERKPHKPHKSYKRKLKEPTADEDPKKVLKRENQRRVREKQQVVMLIPPSNHINLHLVETSWNASDSVASPSLQSPSSVRPRPLVIGLHA
jgi:hypothetical protein